MSGDIADLVGGDGIDSAPSDRSYDAIPPGWYAALIEEAEVRSTQKGGKGVSVQFSLLDARYENRKVFTFLNLVNDNPKAVEIGQRELAALGDAVGLVKVTKTEELINKTLDVRLKVRKRDDGDTDNDVAAFAKIGTKSSDQPASKAPASKPAPAKKAWDQKPAGHPAGSAPAPAAAPAAAAGAGGEPKAAKRPWER